MIYYIVLCVFLIMMYGFYMLFKEVKDLRLQQNQHYAWLKILDIDIGNLYRNEKNEFVITLEEDDV